MAAACMYVCANDTQPSTHHCKRKRGGRVRKKRGRKVRLGKKGVKICRYEEYGRKEGGENRGKERVRGG